MNDSGTVSEQNREEAFRQFQAEHLRRQTDAIEMIKRIMILWLVLSLLGTWIMLAAAT
jgi:hypothetical protein